MGRISVFVAGASGFVGRRLVPALVRAGWHVVAGSRRAHAPEPGVAWVVAPLDDEALLDRAMAGCDAAVLLVHGLARRDDYRAWEEAAARRFARVAARQGLSRIVYLGGLAPRGRASTHLASRLAVGAILREGPVPAIELRASMLIGSGSASWTLARDLAFRLPGMITPRWVRSRTQPLAVDDAVAALVAALEPPVPAPAILDLPGPETVTLEELLRRVARQRGLAPRIVPVPVLSLRMSTWWLRLVTDADRRVARSLVLGLASDLLAHDDAAWRVLGHPALVPLDVAIARAVADDARAHAVSRTGARVESWLARAARASRAPS